MKRKVAVAGAGIYGATAAIRLAEQGHDVSLFDPLGILQAASAINAGRIHAGYHYPRSLQTIAEVLAAKGEFLTEFAPAIVWNSRNYYAIPKDGSRTPAADYETLMASAGLPLRACRPEWMDFDYIQSCYQVDEYVYDPDALRELVTARIGERSIRFVQHEYRKELRGEFDFIVWATYGLGNSRALFRSVKTQVAEKALIELPPALRGLAVVVVDGPFTAFDPYGSTEFSMFGSAKHTNHWSSVDPTEPIPDCYRAVLHKPVFQPVTFTRFEAMKADCCLAIPGAKEAVYRGSRFAIRVVEDSPEDDRRTLYVKETDPGELHIFSGKVVSAVKAARLVCEAVTRAD
jgi:hypothetical protein